MKAASLRTCIGCRRTTPAGELLRLVLTADGSLALGNRGGRAGRGASIHRKDTCVQKAITTRSFARAFRGRALQVDGPELATVLLAHIAHSEISTNVPILSGR
jgi:predicted RNA-binding protein YlxR (DUF448 family)